MDVSYQNIIFLCSAHQHSLYKTISPRRVRPLSLGYLLHFQGTKHEQCQLSPTFPPTITSQKAFSDFK
jgi:hypothetical protein